MLWRTYSNKLIKLPVLFTEYHLAVILTLFQIAWTLYNINEYTFHLLTYPCPGFLSVSHYSKNWEWHNNAIYI